MRKAMQSLALLALIPLGVLKASSFVRNDLAKVEVVDWVENISQETTAKTGIHLYMEATNEHFPAGYNIVEHTQSYQATLKKPYVVIVLAPFAKITQASSQRGRIAVIASDATTAAMYDKQKVSSEAIDVIAINDGNSLEDKVNIAILQSYSELADEVAASQGKHLQSTLKDSVSTFINILRVIVYSGSALLLWIFWIRPMVRRREDG